MSRRPDYNVCVKPKEGGNAYTKIGGAWKDDQGRISITLHPCVVLSAKDDVWISLYPNNYQNQGEKHRQKDYSRSHDNPDNWGPPPMSDDDVPF